MKYTSLLLLALLVISCGTQQKTVKNTSEKTPETVFTIIDSIQDKFDEIAQRDSLNRFKNTKNTTDGYITDDGETVTTEFVPAKKDSLNSTKNQNLTWKKVKGDVIRTYGELSYQNTPYQPEIWNELLQKHVSIQGNVDYKGFKKDHALLKKYIRSLSDETEPVKEITKETKLAYWINAYNALTIDLILRNYPVKSIKDIKKPWDQRLWMVGYLSYSLNDIEHKILRKLDEPRIHFAINCASFSCPPLLNEAFTEEKLEQQLTQVTKAFLADSQRNTITADKIEISKIFKWFTKDFKQNGSLIDFLNQYSEVKINKNAKKKYKDYDWTLNE